MIWIALGLVVLLMQVPFIIALEYRRPAKALAWLAVIIMLPLAGLVMYFFIERRYRDAGHQSEKQLLPSSFSQTPYVGNNSHFAALDSGRGVTGRDWSELSDACPQVDEKLLYLLERFPPSSALSKYNQIRVLTNGGETFDAILRAMDRSVHHIHLDYYIFREQGIGEQFTKLMIKKAKEGVEVRFIYDGIGSLQMSDSFLERLRSYGVKIGCFSPPWPSLLAQKVNYRNHRKIVIVDGKIGFFGGINIGDEYLGKDPKLGHWRDTHIQVEGEAVHTLQEAFLRDWQYVTGRHQEPTYHFSGELYFPEVAVQSVSWIQIISGGPDSDREVIQASVLTCIAAAKHSIRIATPYFIPDRAVISALKLAASGGVDVTVLLPGVPDRRIMYWASRSYMLELLQAGVRFYYYDEGFLHAKVILVDNCIGSVGTANMDMRSYFKNFEINALLFDSQAVARLQEDFAKDLQASIEFTQKDYRQRRFMDKVKEAVAHIISPLL